ncbi:hypothetical protein PGR10_05395 [Klebsiella sp. 141198]|uniref:hypothetical protein n=1 Tax=Klebsiella sp. 141198 TaxID=3020036 RepID=UPI003D354F9B
MRPIKTAKRKVVAAMALLVVSLLYISFYLRVDDVSCERYKNSRGLSDIFLEAISNSSESVLGSWRYMNNKYGILLNGIALEITKNPKDYIVNAIDVIAGEGYDQTQKMFTVILMQNLPIREYMCFMDVANRSFEKGIIDKEVVRFAILPDVNVHGASLYYWWLPDWRKRFLKNADYLFDKNMINDVLSGDYFFYSLRE